jgi:hypothetical protein
MKHIVKSLEGIEFVVESDQRTAPFDIAFAKARPAAELERHGDFARVSGSKELIPFVALLPRIAGPEERRKAFRLIRGGKS